VISLVNQISSSAQLQERALDPAAARIAAAVKGAGSLSAADLEALRTGGPKPLVAHFLDDEAALDRLGEIFSQEALDELIRLDFPSHQGAVEMAREMIGEAKIYLEKTSPAPVSLQAKIGDMASSVLHCLETIINAFGISEFSKPAENKSEAKLKAQMIMTLLQFFMLLSTVALPILGANAAGMAVGCSLLAICLLSTVYPYIRPMPASIAKTENWSRKIRLQQMDVPEGRRVQAKDIADALVAGRKTKRGYPLLIGNTGVGKTDAAKAFAAAVVRGEFPELKGKAIFYINTADFAAGMDAHKYLSHLSDQMGRHRENIILIWDEIHLASRPGTAQVLGEQLKTMLGHEFPYVVGITTEEEFHRNIYIENPALANRFKQIAVQNTSPGETQQILSTALLKEAPSVFIEPDALPYLVERTAQAFGPDAAMPAASLRILSLCLKKTSEKQKTALQKKAEAVRARIDSLQADLIAQGMVSHEKRREVKELFQELASLETRLRRQSSALAKLFADRDRYLALKNKTYRAAIEIAKNPSCARSHFLLASHYVLPALEEKIRRRAESLGVKTTLDHSLIDQVIDAEKEAQEKATLALEHGKAKAALRKK